MIDVDCVLPKLSRRTNFERRERRRIDCAFGDEDIGALAVLGGELVGSAIPGPDEREAGVLPVEAVS